MISNHAHMEERSDKWMKLTQPDEILEKEKYSSIVYTIMKVTNRKIEIMLTKDVDRLVKVNTSGIIFYAR